MNGSILAVVDDLAKVLAMEHALERLGVEIRHEPLAIGDEQDARGGLCVIRGRWMLFVPAGAALPERVALLVDALRRLPTDDLWLPPAIRALVEGRG
jgi:hypothetical protein